MFQKHAGTGCSGVQVLVGDEGRFRPFETYLWLLREARRLAPEPFDWRSEAYEFETERPAIDLLLGDARLRPLLESGASLEEMSGLWRDELAGFAERREAWLRYA
jgi:uncharacterized protein YbbC (DUF1343 family)